MEPKATMRRANAKKAAPVPMLWNERGQYASRMTCRVEGRKATTFPGVTLGFGSSTTGAWPPSSTL